MKRKIIFQFTSVFMMVLLCAFTVSCGDDDENDAGSNTGDSRPPTTANSGLTSRLKDKQGNPVLLEGIKDAEGNWTLKYDYNNDGMHVGFQQNEKSSNYIKSDTTFFNGLSYTSNWRNRNGHYTIKGQITLNEQGLIAKNAVEITGPNASGNIVGSFDIFFTYNDKRQMIKYEFKNVQSPDNTEEDDDSLRQMKWSNDNLVFNGESRTFSDKENITRQPVINQFLLVMGGFQPLCALGLYGVGSANFTRWESNSCTLNENGTIATLGGSTYYYK